MTPGQIAINSVSTRQKTLGEALEAYAAAGFKQVEFQFSSLKEWLGAGNSVPETKVLLDRLDLRCIGGFESSLIVFGDDREENERLQMANAKLLFEIAGGGVIVAGAEGPPPDMDPFEALQQIGIQFARIADRTDPTVSFAVEFNWGPLVKSVRSARIVVDAADHPCVGILFDPAHYHCTTSKLEDLTPEVVAKILHVHMADMADKPGECSHCNLDRVLPGKGTLDLSAIIGRLEQHGYRGAFSIEMFNQDLWNTPVGKAAHLMYESMAALCRPL